MTDGELAALKNWLKEYMDVRFAGSDRLRDEQYETGQRALAAAKTEMDRRLGEMNEFRAQILRERQDFIGRLEFEAKSGARDELGTRLHQNAEHRLRALETWQAKVVGALVLLGAVGASSLAVSLLTLMRRSL
jgi:hypothetical protein